MITMPEQKRAVCALFNVIPEDVSKPIEVHTITEQLTRGFLVLDCDNSPCEVGHEYFCLIDKLFGFGIWRFNNTFHKSFQTVADMPWEQYVAEQCLHYLSTYGMEKIGLKAVFYIPLEKLELPDNVAYGDNGITIIRIKSQEEIKELINDYVRQTITPSPTAVDCFKALAAEVDNVEDITSYELKCIWYDTHGEVPQDPAEFLRFLVYETIGSTLLIKNRDTINAIKAHEGDPSFSPIDYFNKISPTSLAKIFFRYKPIFLAYKEWASCKPYINKVRRLADRYHEPMRADRLQNLSLYIKNEDWNTVNKIISKASNRELIKMIYYFGNVYGNAPAIYNIRNGKTFVKADTHNISNTEAGFNACMKELRDRLYPIYHGKYFYIPKDLRYAAPYSEKQFIGKLPWGTKLGGDLGTAITAGIAWNNTDGIRTDLDLHLNSPTQHFGWNGDYKSEDKIIYTGDMTDATNGAAEAYWFDFTDNAYILSVNKYTGAKKVPFTLFFSSVKPEAKDRNYTFNPAEAICSPLNLEFKDDFDMSLGIFTDHAFYLYGGSLSAGRVPRNNYKDYVEGMLAKVKTCPSLEWILEICGATIVRDLKARIDEDIEIVNLAPQNLNSMTLLSIVDGTYEF